MERKHRRQQLLEAQSLYPEKMSDSQRREAQSIQQVGNTSILIPNNTVHGHASRLFQQMVDAASDRDSCAHPTPYAPTIDPRMKIAFYRFLEKYTSLPVTEDSKRDERKL
jgi:hypothetical protein